MDRSDNTVTDVYMDKEQEWGGWNGDERVKGMGYTYYIPTDEATSLN